MSPDLLRRTLARLFLLFPEEDELLQPGPAALLALLLRDRERIDQALVAAAGADADGLEILAGLVDMPRPLLFARLGTLSALLVLGEAVWLRASMAMSPRSAALGNGTP